MQRPDFSAITALFLQFLIFYLHCYVLCWMVSFSMSLSDPWRSWHRSTSSNSKMVQDWAILKWWSDQEEVIYELSNSAIFRDLEWSNPRLQWHGTIQFWVSQKQYNECPSQMCNLNDLHWLGKISKNMKCHTVSLCNSWPSCDHCHHICQMMQSLWWP